MSSLDALRVMAGQPRLAAVPAAAPAVAAPAPAVVVVRGSSATGGVLAFGGLVGVLWLLTKSRDRLEQPAVVENENEKSEAPQMVEVLERDEAGVYQRVQMMEVNDGITAAL